MKPAAIVTGASRGIGRAVATELAKTHNVIGTYRGRRDAAEQLRAETGAEIFPCDISRREDRDALLALRAKAIWRRALTSASSETAPAAPGTATLRNGCPCEISAR